MYLDLYNNITINKKLLKVVGMPAALYWAELQEILQKVITKKTFNEQGFFKLDREYVSRETTLTLKEQYACDMQLKQLGVLLVDENNPDSIAVSAEKMIAIISAEDPKLLKDLAKAAKPTRAGKKVATEEDKLAKQNAIRDNLIKTLVEPDKAVYDAAVLWIQTIFELGKYAYKMSKAGVASFLNTIHQTGYPTSELVEIISIATREGFTEAAWAIDRYKKTHAVSATRLTTNQKKATELGIQF